MKKLSIVLALVFVFCFGSIVFAQNANSATTNDSSASMTGRKHGRRHGRRHRRHGRRHGRSTKTSKATTGNANK